MNDSKGNVNFQNVIDLSKMKKKNKFTPSAMPEVFFPSTLYKLNTESRMDTEQTPKKSQQPFSVFQSSYEMPNVDVINEWVIVLESLL